MWPPDYSTSILQVFNIFEELTSKVLLHFEYRKNSDGARSGLYGGCLKMSQWNCSRSKACVCQAVLRCALLCNRTIPRESLSLLQDNLRSHRPAKKLTTPRTSQSAEFSIDTALATAISALTTWQGLTYNWMRQLFNITLNTRNNDRLQ